MGLFSKKPNSDAAGDPYADQAMAEQARPEAISKATSKKLKKLHVDPIDFLNLRAELLDVKARLEAAEQSKALVETRLAALDATTTAMASERQGGHLAPR